MSSLDKDKQPLKLRISAIIAIAVIAILILAIIIYFAYRSLTTKHQDNMYLKEAKAILDQIDKHKDSRGFYGAAQTCTFDENTQEYTCQLETMDYLGDGTQYASHRQSLAVIWARYQYYAATGDKSELDKLKKDLTNMYNLVVDEDDTIHNWILQTNRLNCVLMSDLVNSPLLEQEYKDMAYTICNDAEFEYFTDSQIIFDGHNHPLYKIINYADYPDEILSDEFIVETDTQHGVDPAYITNHTAAQLIQDITDLLTEYAATGSITNKTTVDTAYTQRFITRELLAAIDQVAKMKLNQERGNTQLAEQNLIDYLILTKETLEWYASGYYDQFSIYANDSCLLRSNLEYLFDNYLTALGIEHKEQVLERVVNFSDVKPGVLCVAANHYLNHVPIDKTELLMQEQDSIYQLTYDSRLYFDVYNNALISGLLAE